MLGAAREVPCEDQARLGSMFGKYDKKFMAVGNGLLLEEPTS